MSAEVVRPEEAEECNLTHLTWTDEAESIPTLFYIYTRV